MSDDDIDDEINSRYRRRITRLFRLLGLFLKLVIELSSINQQLIFIILKGKQVSNSAS